MYKPEEIKEYWNDRAVDSKGNPSATTQDVFLRELEIKKITETIKNLRTANLIRILDVGCGDGYSTIRIAENTADAVFIGVDYSSKMIENANVNGSKHKDLSSKVTFQVGDATKIDELFEENEFDFVLSDRCLINLTSSEIQYETISKIQSLLKGGGFYLAIENFIDGQNELNKTRTAVGLEEIDVRWHNLFFNQNDFINKTQEIYSSVKIEDFSSAYYYATRVIYSKYCRMKNINPDYKHEIHRLAVDLPAYGNFSPIKLAVLKK